MQRHVTALVAVLCTGVSSLAQAEETKPVVVHSVVVTMETSGWKLDVADPQPSPLLTLRSPYPGVDGENACLFSRSQVPTGASKALSVLVGNVNLVGCNIQWGTPDGPIPRLQFPRGGMEASLNLRF